MVIVSDNWYDNTVLDMHSPVEHESDDIFYEHLLGDFNSKVGTKDIFRSTIWNESLLEIIWG
jgi:hypothetical protein